MTSVLFLVKRQELIIRFFYRIFRCCRKVALEASRTEEIKTASHDDSSSPSQADKAALERDRLRLKEQERRRREAVCTP